MNPDSADRKWLADKASRQKPLNVRQLDVIRGAVKRSTPSILSKTA